MHLDLLLFRAHDGRVEGRIRSNEGAVVTFSGTLELLRAIEDLDPEPPPAECSDSNDGVREKSNDQRRALRPRLEGMP
jgi:hypothetical protein